MSYPNVFRAPVNNWGTLTVATANPGTEWTRLAANQARTVRIHNGTGTAVSVAPHGATTTPYTLADGETQDFPVKGNTSEITVKRVDDDNTPVTLSAVWSD